MRADVGCGPGWHSGELGTPVVAFDAAPAMAAQVRDFAPAAWPMVADLEHLPFRTGALTGRVGAPLVHAHPERVAADGAGGAAPVDERSAGRYTCRSPPTASTTTRATPFRAATSPGGPSVRLRDVVEGAGFVVESFVDDGEEWIDVEATRARMLADTVGPGMRGADRRARTRDSCRPTSA